MDLLLTRNRFTNDGVFGELKQLSGILVCMTLEHSYSGIPKLPDGSYTCVRGLHQLEGHPDPFMTFEIANVPGHSKILFHQGDWQTDSEGCVLLGMQSDATRIYSSHIAFENFMTLQGDSSSFLLTVTSEVP
jgi:hypothetical protein